MNRSVLITGGLGFIGSNLVPKLLSRGMKISILDNFSSGNKTFVPSSRVKIIRGDIRNRDDVLKSLSGIECVIHLAASGSVVESIINPEKNFNVNVNGTLNLLQGCMSAGVNRFIFASTGGALIGEAEPPVNELSLPKPISPYGASKLCGEAYCHAYAKSYGLKTIALRFANIYGPHSAHKKGVITVFSKAIIQGKQITIYGDGNASRDFLYVDDLCQCIILVLDKDIEPGAIFHIASGVETKIVDLARELMKIAGKPEYPIRYEASRKGEVIRNFASLEKAETKLGFRTKISLEEGLKRTWNWLRRQTINIA